MSIHKKILLVGVAKPPTDGPALPEELKAKVGNPNGLKQILTSIIEEASEKGYDVQVMQLADQEKSLAWAEEVRATLANGPWDGFIIGNGIRGTPSLTLCFEQLVAICREVAPDTPMGFNTHPLDVLPVIERVCAGR